MAKQEDQEAKDPWLHDGYEAMGCRSKSNNKAKGGKKMKHFKEEHGTSSGRYGCSAHARVEPTLPVLTAVLTPD